jgi:histidinol dehydrogenase
MTLEVLTWSKMNPAERRAALGRPVHDAPEVERAVRDILAEVRREGDAALRRYTEKFDGVRLENFAVTADEFNSARASLTEREVEALRRAIDNVRRFHAAQRTPALAIETSPGMRCERIEVPLRAVGLYVPAGSAPLPSTAIMNAVPAQIMGCPIRVLCTPPRADGRADPAVLTVAAMCGIEQVFKVGGVQAIAAMAYGTDSVPKVDKVFGPGNAWVTAAKLLVSRDPEGAALDLPAGPSEVLVIADQAADPALVAADLLAQAEHDPRAHVMLVTTHAAFVDATLHELERQLPQLSRKDIAAQALGGSRAIVVEDLSTAFEVSNLYAPEHLIVHVLDARAWLPRITTAGSVFLGPWTPESLGDYCSGPNHVLPTYGYARAYSGLSLSDFGRRMTVQEASPAALADLGPVAVTLAGLEGLDAHARAVTIRLEQAQRAGSERS